MGEGASRFRRIARLKAVDSPAKPEAGEGPEEPASIPRPSPLEPAPVAPGGEMVEMRRLRAAPRAWNVWELEQLARAGVRQNPERSQEWAYLLVHLRQYATPDGALPREFDALVRESFGELLETSGLA